MARARTRPPHPLPRAYPPPITDYRCMTRMRNATILVVKLRGVATETIKNIVLAGIGKLIIWDCEDVAAEDLGVGFFFRDEDVGKKVRFCLDLSQ
jgi:molybdopterin/thiamine biosynthesis adenylyltransferase